MILVRVVDIDQLVECSSPTAEIRGSNPVIGKSNCIKSVLKNKEKEAGNGLFLNFVLGLIPSDYETQDQTDVQQMLRC